MEQVDQSNASNTPAERRQLIKKWTEVLNSENYTPQASFLTVNKNREEFGVLTMPDEFADRFGDMLPFCIAISCQKLDYLGEGLFVATLFKDTAMELEYPVWNPSSLDMDKKWEEDNRDDYVVNPGTPQFDRCVSSIFFNGCSNKDGYAGLLVLHSDMEMDGEIMALKSSWQEFSDDWKNGCFVSLKYEEKSWYIQINKTVDGCYFGKGWKDFYDAVGLQEGDFIVCFREKVKESHKLIVCIYRTVDRRNALDNVMKDFNASSKSFFKIIHDKAASSGYLMVPFLVEKLYCWKLRQVEKISIAGVQSRFYYLSFPGYMYMLQDLFKDFRVRINDTLIFTLNGSKTINCRIYQANGMEIDYVYRVGKKNGGGSTEWIWNFEAQSGIGEVEALNNATEHGQILEVPADNDLTFTAILTSGNLDKKTHGLFIPENVKPSRGRWLRSDDITFITDKGLWKVGIAQTGKRPRFSAGWNSFVRNNMYTPGQHLHFRLVEQGDVIEFHISKI